MSIGIISSPRPSRSLMMIWPICPRCLRGGGGALLLSAAVLLELDAAALGIVVASALQSARGGNGMYATFKE